MQKVGYYLGIGLADKLNPFSDKLVFKVEIVFDNTVVNNGDFAVAAAVRVGVGVRGRAVGSPTGVTYTNITLNGCAVLGIVDK